MTIPTLNMTIPRLNMTIPRLNMTIPRLNMTIPMLNKFICYEYCPFNGFLNDWEKRSKFSFKEL